MQGDLDWYNCSITRKQPNITLIFLKTAAKYSITLSQNYTIFKYWCLIWDKPTTVLQQQMMCFLNRIIECTVKVLSQKHERGEGSMNSFHAWVSEIMFPYSISLAISNKYSHTNRHRHRPKGKLEQTKRWMTALCWDEEEAWQHEECLGGIRRHFWFGMVSKMYVMSSQDKIKTPFLYTPCLQSQVAFSFSLFW